MARPLTSVDGFPDLHGFRQLPHQEDDPDFPGRPVLLLHDVPWRIGAPAAGTPTPHVFLPDDLGGGRPWGRVRRHPRTTGFRYTHRSPSGPGGVCPAGDDRLVEAGNPQAWSLAG